MIKKNLIGLILKKGLIVEYLNMQKKMKVKILVDAEEYKFKMQ